MRAHAVHTCLKWLLGAIGIASMVSASIAQACPGIGGNEPFPTVRRLEIANPQAPAKPFLAQAVSDVRTLMALQGETIDLIYTLAEPIPSGCVYNLDVSNRAREVTSNLIDHPWMRILLPKNGIKSEPTTGVDNTIKFKIEVAPQFDDDKVITLYARISGQFRSGDPIRVLTDFTPFKFKNLAYKFTNISKEPARDATGKVIGIKVKAQLNAMPREADTLPSPYSPILFSGNFFTRYPGINPAPGKGMTEDQRNFDRKYNQTNDGRVIKLNNTPMITWIVQNIGGGATGQVQAHLGFMINDQKYQRPDGWLRSQPIVGKCQSNYSEMARYDFCSSATLIDIP